MGIEGGNQKQVYTMRDVVPGLRDDLIRIQDFLGRSALLSFSPEEKQKLLVDSRKLLQKLDDLSGNVLTVGLLGGTGVGKSTLMNALAGADISSTSHRRPHTNQVLIYHHEEIHLPSTIRGSKVPRRDFAHNVDAIRQILLCDLPDFDSLMGENRENVLRFLEHLDVLVWVVSLEKYADRKFYEFLRMAPKASPNFYFILNKMDRLFDGRPPEVGYDELGKVAASFQQHLKESGIPDPFIYTLSARDALEQRSQAPWNQFPTFSRQIFQQRDIKEITAIKAANLDLEVRQTVSVLRREVMNLELLHRALEDSAADLESERAEWNESGRRSIDSWVDRTLKHELLSEMGKDADMVGTGRVLATVMQEWQRWARERREGPTPPVPFQPPEYTETTLKRHLERVRDRIVHHVLQMGLPTGFIAEVESLLDVQEEWEVLSERWRGYLEMRIKTDVSSSFKRFIAIQFVTYFFLFLIFLLALSGEAVWKQLLVEPDWSDLLYVALAAVYTLFSPTGLAALGTYILLNLFLGFRFYGRYKKLLQHRTQRVIESCKTQMSRIWEDELDRLVERLKRFGEQVMAQLSELSELRSPAKGD